MTVKELKEKLNDFDDDADVYVMDSYYDEQLSTCINYNETHDIVIFY